MKKLLIILSAIAVLFVLPSYTGVQTLPVGITSNYAAEIDWLTWEEVQEKMKVEKRKVFVDLYTDWCGWCKRMDNSTFKDPDIIEYLNNNYYCVKFNAEQKEPIELKGKNYKFVKTGNRGYHELAAVIAHGRLSYPTTVFLDEKFMVIQAIPGFKSPESFERIITYFATNNYTRVPWTTYQKSYVPLKERATKLVRRPSDD